MKSIFWYLIVAWQHRPWNRSTGTLCHGLHLIAYDILPYRTDSPGVSGYQQFHERSITMWWNGRQRREWRWKV
jgi:hypothetical protein